MKKLVLGIGNTLNHDEGLGVHALEYIRNEMAGSDHVEIQDGGTLGLSLLLIVEECSHLLVLDAIDAGKAAGSIVELAGDEISMSNNAKMSNHQTTFHEVLGFAKLRGKLPHDLHLLGIQPADTSLGIGLSDTVLAAMPGLIARALEIVKPWMPVS